MKRNDQFDRWVYGHAGVFTRNQALSNGITERRFRTGVERREWVKFRGVWRLADHPAEFSSEIWAMLFRAGPGARITAHTSLTLLGLEGISRRLIVVQPRPRRIHALEATVLRDKMSEGGCQYVGGYPSVSRTRAVIDALRVSSWDEACQILHESLRLRWVSPGTLDQACKLLARHKGLRQLRELTAYAHSGSRAESERLLAQLLSGADVGGWRMNVEIRDERNHIIGVVDFVFENERLLIEVDGQAWHTSVDRFQRDRTRQNHLTNAGWRVLRFTWQDLESRPKEVLSSVKQALLRQRV